MNEYTVIRSNDHLAHYGVLGMKWGVRKDRSSGRTPRLHGQNKKYSSAQRSKDYSKWGARGVRRINRRMNRGQTLAKARKPEVKRTSGNRASAKKYAKAAAYSAGGAYIASKILSRPPTVLPNASRSLDNAAMFFGTALGVNAMSTAIKAVNSTKKAYYLGEYNR